MSYFAKPNYIPYDEWFDDDLEKEEITFFNKRRKYLSNIHEFFYRQSKNKIGASENLLNLDYEEKSKQKLTNNSSYNFPENYFYKGIIFLSLNDSNKACKNFLISKSLNFIESSDLLKKYCR